jgi:hypothetical protein
MGNELGVEQVGEVTFFDSCAEVAERESPFLAVPYTRDAVGQCASCENQAPIRTASDADMLVSIDTLVSLIPGTVNPKFLSPRIKRLPWVPNGHPAR